ncbi:MAG: EscU/YscU/HrcU family type III secretion system export apparatus switch protein, partial [Anaerolineales bacterium]
MPDKTEAPTPRKLNEARKEGMVALSQELTSAVVLFISVWLLTSPGRRMINGLQIMIVDTLTTLPNGEVTGGWYLQRLTNFAIEIGKDVVFIVLGLLFTAMVVTFAQTRFLISTRKMKF